MWVFAIFSVIVLTNRAMCYVVHQNPYSFDDHVMHPAPKENVGRAKRQVYSRQDHWLMDAQLALRDRLLIQPNTNVAKNVIFFLGDGMSIPTLAASRMYMGQLQGDTGEEAQLSFETFPYVGLSKTYCVDKQVADSACSATAYLSGIKANYGTIGVKSTVAYDDCIATSKSKNHVSSIATWAQRVGKGTGVVTTTRITHASPAGTYAHVGNRDWESDADVLCRNHDPKLCQDIASQLILNEPGSNFKVILGGGRSKFLPETQIDEENKLGHRKDGVNLIGTWKKTKKGSGQYVHDRAGLMGLDYNKTDYLLGLFESDHMQYHLEADKLTEPTLAEMTEAAIKLLQNEKKGYYLFVEGGRIDHAHHETKAQKALDETVQFSDAIQKAVDMTLRKDTLIVVTSDHAHTMSLSGYAQRGQNILGLNSELSDVDHMPYTTLSYANGPGYVSLITNGTRANLTTITMETDQNYMYPSSVPLESETHGGDDVGVFALGPWAHLFSGVYEQNVIPHLIGYASCMGDGLTLCKEFK